MPRPMNQIRAPIADHSKPGEHGYFVLERRDRVELRHDFVPRADFRRHPARTARGRIGETQSPEVRAESHRQWRATRKRRAIGVEEDIEHGQPDIDGRAPEHALQYRTTIETQ